MEVFTVVLHTMEVLPYFDQESWNLAPWTHQQSSEDYEILLTTMFLDADSKMRSSAKQTSYIGIQLSKY